MDAPTGLRDALIHSGIEVVPAADHTRADVAFHSGRGWRKAPGQDAVVFGRSPAWPVGGARRSRRQDYLVVSGAAGPATLALATPEVRHHLARVLSRPSSLGGRLRNTLVASPVGAWASTVSVVSERPGLPYPLAQALPPTMRASVTGWLFLLRAGDDMQRVVVLVFDGRGTPSAVVKFARRPGAPGRGKREVSVLAELARRAPAQAASATVVLRTGTLDGCEFTVERAARGADLSSLLRGSRGRPVPAAERALVWSRAVGEATVRDDPPARDAWLSRALDGWDAGTVADRLDRVPLVLAHQDLGSWNVLADEDDIVVVDWESASLGGLALSDTAYLLTDLLVHAHGPVEDSARTRWAAELWAGALPQSPLLEEGLREGARRLHLQDDQLAAIATATWLHHGQSRRRRADLLQSSAAGGYLGELAHAWCGDTRLGTAWRGFSTWRS